MYCKGCGRKYSKEVKFCGICGTKFIDKDSETKEQKPFSATPSLPKKSIFSTSTVITILVITFLIILNRTP